MDFVANQETDVQDMLKAIGVSSIDELFSAIPKALLLMRPTVDDGMSELEGMALAKRVAKENTFISFESYLGAGAYEHHISPLVQAIASKSEFLTSYTPYQPEASQGMLQCIFEYQSAICAVTGMEVANASVWDGASSVAEACLMALRHFPDRKKILVSEGVHPHYRNVVEQYLKSLSVEMETIGLDEKLRTVPFQAAADVACVVMQSPNFFGVRERFRQFDDPLLILVANPIAYGIFPSASQMRAAIAVGDSQPLGLPLNFGGPYAGYMACKKELIRQMPGRIVGETVDSAGRRGFVLTLQAREQHIRREKATSNICTNQALAALQSLVQMLWYGKEGMRALALTNYRRTAYLREGLKARGCEILSCDEHFNEFVVRFRDSQMESRFREAGIIPGLELGRYFERLRGAYLVAVTETKTKAMLDRFLGVLS